MTQLRYDFDDLLVTCTQEIITNGLDSSSIPSTIKDWLCGQIVKSLPTKLLNRFLTILLKNKNCCDFIALKECDSDNVKQVNAPDQMVLLFCKTENQKKWLEEEARIGKLKRSRNFIGQDGGGGGGGAVAAEGGGAAAARATEGAAGEETTTSTPTLPNREQTNKCGQIIIPNAHANKNFLASAHFSDPDLTSSNQIFTSTNTMTKETFNFCSQEFIVERMPEKNFPTFKSVNFQKINFESDSDIDQELELYDSSFLEGEDLDSDGLCLLTNDLGEDQNSEEVDESDRNWELLKRRKRARARSRAQSSVKISNLGVSSDSNCEAARLKKISNTYDQDNNSTQSSTVLDAQNWESKNRRMKKWEATEIANNTPELLKDPGEAGRYSCKLCESRQFNTAREALEHVSNLHKNNKKTYCTICDKRFTTPRGYKTHILKHMGVKDFKCDTCDTSVTTAYSLVNHKKVKHPEVYAAQYAEFVRLKNDRKANPLKYVGKVIYNPLTHKVTTKFSDKPMKYRYDQPYEKAVDFSSEKISRVIDRVLDDSRQVSSLSGMDGYESTASYQQIQLWNGAGAL